MRQSIQAEIFLLHELWVWYYMSQGSTDLIGLFILLKGDKEHGIKDLVRCIFDNDLKTEYLPLFTDKFAAKRFLKDMNIGGAVVKLEEDAVRYVVQMCREENYIPAIDIVRRFDGQHVFKRVDLSGN
jgi:hypothetical protein